MKKLLFCSLLFSLIACHQQPQSNEAAPLRRIEASEIQKIQANETLSILDVRTPQEYASGHLKGAQNLDFYTANFSEQLNALDKSQPYLIYCKSGGRSGKTLNMMKKAGFQKVYEVKGGIDAISSAAIPLEK